MSWMKFKATLFFTVVTASWIKLDLGNLPPKKCHQVFLKF